MWPRLDQNNPFTVEFNTGRTVYRWRYLELTCPIGSILMHATVLWFLLSRVPPNPVSSEASLGPFSCNGFSFYVSCNWKLFVGCQRTELSASSNIQQYTVFFYRRHFFPLISKTRSSRKQILNPSCKGEGWRTEMQCSHLSARARKWWSHDKLSRIDVLVPNKCDVILSYSNLLNETHCERRVMGAEKRDAINSADK